MNDLPLYSSSSLPADFAAPGGHAWAEFRKTALTKAIRIDGPFRVETSESENEPFLCQDGWLAVDARGYPYAIADDEFSQIYEPAVPEPTDQGSIHPAAASLLRFFAHDHLPQVLQDVSRPFAELAQKVATDAEGPETTTALRKLLEAKDCAVRAALPPAPAYPLIGKD